MATNEPSGGGRHRGDQSYARERTLNRWCEMVKPVNMAQIEVDSNKSGTTIKRACKQEVIIDGNNVKCTKKTW